MLRLYQYVEIQNESPIERTSLLVSMICPAIFANKIEYAKVDGLGAAMGIMSMANCVGNFSERLTYHSFLAHPGRTARWRNVSSMWDEATVGG